jgi:hypothetical protein
METTEAEFDDRDAITPGDEHVLQRARGRWRAMTNGEKSSNNGENPALQSHAFSLQ